jgi:nucleotide-binding universal stress UspA family protein
MTQVLIAVDDSESSVKTARTAYALFGDTATYTVVSVAESPMMWGGDALVWGIGYPMVLAPTGAPGVAPAARAPGAKAPLASAPLDSAATSDAAEAVVDNAPIDAAIQVAHDVAAEAHLPNPQVVGEVGDPATAIIAAAHHHQADVIVVGSHDRSWFSKLLMPSTSSAVVREADIPVLITR